ncbi:MAG: sigma-70 family RNA polymerase sigma factor [Gemmataceae bacterium]
MDSQAERWKMVESLAKMVAGAVGKVRRAVPGWTAEDSDDLTQDINLQLWKFSESFDPDRGVKWVTYAFPIIDRTAKNAAAARMNRPEVQGELDDLKQRPAPESAPDLDEPDTADDLHGAVQHQLAQGILDKMPAGYRRLVERVVFERLTAEQIAEQDGHPVKSTRANIKAALRWMHSHGLAAMVTADQVRHATAPANPTANEKAKQRAAEQKRDRPKAGKPAKRVYRAGGYVVRLRRQLEELVKLHPSLLDRISRMDADLAALFGLMLEGVVANTAAALELTGLAESTLKYRIQGAMTVFCASLNPPVAYNSSCDSFAPLAA